MGKEILQDLDCLLIVIGDKISIDLRTIPSTLQKVEFFCSNIFQQFSENVKLFNSTLQLAKTCLVLAKALKNKEIPMTYLMLQHTEDHLYCD
jgi:hypothetical protein